MSLHPEAEFLFTSESVNEGHPDKLADQVRALPTPRAREEDSAESTDVASGAAEPPLGRRCLEAS